MAPNYGSTSAHRGLKWAVAAAVGLVAWFVFHNAIRGSMLQWDDDINLQGNVHLRALTAANIRWMFTDSTYVRRYVPLGWLAFAVDYRFFGPGPRSYHVLNLALHSADSALVFLLVLKGKGRSLWWAALAALGPLGLPFLAMLDETMQELERFGLAPELSFLRFVASKVDENKSMQKGLLELMRQLYGSAMIRTPLKDSAEIDNATARLMTVYELAGPMTSKAVRDRCLTYLDGVCGEIEVDIRRMWPSHLARLRKEGHA